MRKLFTLMLAVLFLGSAYAQTEVYHEHFADSAGVDAYDFTAIDVDGDGHNWQIDVYNSEIYMISETWDGTSPLTPHNMLISPAIDLNSPDSVNYDSVFVEYFIASATTSDYYAEHYKFVVADGTDTTAVNNGEILHEETLTADQANGAWTQRMFDISSYIGESVNLAWVHYDCTDQYKLMLDSISVMAYTSSVGMEAIQMHRMTVYPNPATNYLKVNYKGTSDATVEVYAVNGQLIKKYADVQPGDALGIGNLPAGTYMLRVTNVAGVQTQKFMIE